MLLALPELVLVPVPVPGPLLGAVADEEGVVVVVGPDEGVVVELDVGVVVVVVPMLPVLLPAVQLRVSEL